jgi:hypothetical protein
MATCGTADDLGYCRERFHQPGCGSAATPDITEALRPELELAAMRPFAGANGRAWLDQQYGSPMSLTDHIEAATGQRLADASLWESHRGHRRELASPARPATLGDPDNPDAISQAIPAATARTAAAMAAQAGIGTPADARAQRAAFARERARQQARYKPPQHTDYRDFSNPVRPAAGPVQVGDTWNGSLPVY